jgi:hypothetical protein
MFSKNQIVTLLIFGICLMFSYLASAFITLEIDFRNWDQATRALFIIFSPVVSFFPSLIVSDMIR